MQGHATEQASVPTPDASPVQTESTEIKPQKTEVKTPAPSISEEESRHVRHEIRKILLTILVLVIIIVAVSLVNSKTDFILKFGAYAADKLNIKI